MAAQVGLCLAWSETPEDTFCHDKAQMISQLWLSGTTRTFFTGISRLIAQLLQEKEKSNFRAENWLLEEAVKDENVQKAGTFR